MHHVSTLHHVTRRAIKACSNCDCAACKSYAESLERLLLEPADMDKQLDAIVVPHRNLGIDANGSIEGHEHITSLILNLALAWSFATKEVDDETTSGVIEHLGDAWWFLMAHEAKLLLEDAP